MNVRPARFAASAVAVAAAALTGLPAYAQVDPSKIVDQFEATFGKFAGYRRSGAKGVCATGEFTGSADGRALSSASAFSGRPVPVVARFSVGGASPNAPDNGKSQRNMALQFNLPGGVDVADGQHQRAGVRCSQSGTVPRPPGVAAA